jgi:hypothetical protein
MTSPAKTCNGGECQDDHRDAVDIESLSPAGRGSLSFRHFKRNPQSSPYHLKKKARRGSHESAEPPKETSPRLRFAPEDGASLRPAIPRALRGSTRNFA